LSSNAKDIVEHNMPMHSQMVHYLTDLN
jgi:hypothetical protein